MTDAAQRHQAAIESLAVELFRLAHAQELAGDEEERALNADLDLAAVVRMAANLCEHSIGVVAAVMCVLHVLQEHEPERVAEGERITQ
jgi:hypothetical protein